MVRTPPRSLGSKACGNAEPAVAPRGRRTGLPHPAGYATVRCQFFRRATVERRAGRAAGRLSGPPSGLRRPCGRPPTAFSRPSVRFRPLSGHGPSLPVSPRRPGSLPDSSGGVASGRGRGSPGPATPFRAACATRSAPTAPSPAVPRGARAGAERTSVCLHRCPAAVRRCPTRCPGTASGPGTPGRKCRFRARAPPSLRNRHDWRASGRARIPREPVRPGGENTSARGRGS